MKSTADVASVAPSCRKSAAIGVVPGPAESVKTPAPVAHQLRVDGSLGIRVRVPDEHRTDTPVQQGGQLGHGDGRVMRPDDGLDVLHATRLHGLLHRVRNIDI